MYLVTETAILSIRYCLRTRQAFHKIWRTRSMPRECQRPILRSISAIFMAWRYLIPQSVEKSCANMQIRPIAFTIGLIIHFFIALFYVYTEFGIDSLLIIIIINDKFDTLFLLFRQLTVVTYKRCFIFVQLIH